MNILRCKDDLKKMFPPTASVVIFVLYMVLFVAQGLIVTSSRNGSNVYTFNTTTVVLLTEMLKLTISVLVFVAQNNMSLLIQELRNNSRILLLYLVPSLLYCLYNNLAFRSLVYFNPTTYFMFMQIRLLLTGLIYQILFKRKLSNIQWFSLVLLTLGCIIHATGTGRTEISSNSESDIGSFIHLSLGISLILTQVLCSVFAGVFNEYIIKGEGLEVDIMIQNVFMYLDSIFCNIILLGVKGEIFNALTPTSIATVLQTLVLLLIFNNAILGIVTSLFLKKLNSIVKAFASALELVLTAVLSIPVLGIDLSYETVLAIIIISIAVVTYAKHPLKEEPKIVQEKEII